MLESQYVLVLSSLGEEPANLVVARSDSRRHHQHRFLLRYRYPSRSRSLLHRSSHGTQRYVSLFSSHPLPPALPPPSHSAYPPFPPHSSLSVPLELTPSPSAGLWIGLTAALTFTGISSTYIVWGMDWEAESERTRVRLATAKHNDELEEEEEE